jgi:hypothetical protein
MRSAARRTSVQLLFWKWAGPSADWPRVSEKTTLKRMLELKCNRRNWRLVKLPRDEFYNLHSFILVI